MSYASRNTASTLPQGFSIYQPNLGAQLQFLPAIGTPELDELINAYVVGPASTQEKRASVSLDFLEYAHITGQTFKFYPVYSTNTAVESPVTDSGYGSSFNVSPVTSTWDFSQISTSRSPPSQQARTPPKAASSRQQASDFSNIPGMKIMTRDGRDVTNSASRGSKTKEQRDHAHLMRIIKACDSCKRKKIRCDPSHKKRVSPQSQPQPAAKSTKKAKAVAEAVRVAAAPPPAVNVPVQAPDMAPDQTFAPIDLEGFTSSLSALEPWDQFIEYPPADANDEYDFFNDPAGYFSPQSASSSSVSAYSTKPVTPTSQQELHAPYDLLGGTIAVSSQLPFDQTESTSNYVDFNLFSPDSSFSEDEQMVPIELSRHLSNHSYSPQSNTLRSDQSSGDSDIGGGLISSVSDAASWSVSSRQSGEDNSANSGMYRDPGASDGGQDCSPWSSSLSSDDSSHPSSSKPRLTESTESKNAYSRVDYTGQSGSALNDLDQSSIRRGTDTTTTVVYGDTSAGPSGEDRQSTNFETASSDLTTGAPESVHRLKSISTSVYSRAEHATLEAIVAPRTEVSAQQDGFERAVAAIANATTTTPTTVTTTTATGDDSERYAQLNATKAPSTPVRPQDDYAPGVSVNGSEESLSPLMISAGLMMASGLAKSFIEQYIATTMSVMLALAAIGSWFLQSHQRSCNTAIKASHGWKSHANGDAKQTFQATPQGGLQAWWHRGRYLESQLASGTTSVSRMISWSTSLVAV